LLAFLGYFVVKIDVSQNLTFSLTIVVTSSYIACIWLFQDEIGNTWENRNG